MPREPFKTKRTPQPTYRIMAKLSDGEWVGWVKMGSKDEAEAYLADKVARDCAGMWRMVVIPPPKPRAAKEPTP